MPTSNYLGVNQKGFANVLVIGLIVLILVILVGFFLGPFHRNTSFFKTAVFEVAGSTCPQGSLFTMFPIKQNDLLYVFPLGHLNPPDHTIPTDHIYLTVKNTNEIVSEGAKQVFAPGDITIQSIRKTKVIRGGKPQSDDYAIDLSSCKQVRANFGHVTKLSPTLLALVEKGEWDSCDNRKSGPQDESTYCRKQVSFKIASGELIGEAGGGTSTGLDFQLVDRRSEKLNYANPKRYREDQFHYVCPLDYFDQTSKDSLYQKLGNNLTKRTIEPRCGEVNQDKIGTAQGNWTQAEGFIDSPESWSKNLALVHDNVDPNLGELVIGGTISTPAKIQFTPKNEGKINREFSQVKTDETIYCYEGESISQSQGGHSGRVLIQLMSDASLKAEYQVSSCQDNLQFASPTIYQR